MLVPSPHPHTSPVRTPRSKVRIQTCLPLSVFFYSMFFKDHFNTLSCCNVIIVYIIDHTTNKWLFSPSQVQIQKSSSCCWPTLRADGWMTSGCLFLHCQGYRMEVPHQHLLLQRWMQATCVTWSPKSRLAPLIT